MKPRILVVEDEANIAEALLYALETDGFSAVRVSTGRDALALIKEKPFELIILDVGLPDETGFEVCKQIRKISHVPIFFLTARNNEIDKVVGLEIGADDYITKPFSPREVTARIKSLFRRLEGLQTSVSSAKAIGLFLIDETKFQITYKQVLLPLTRYEFGILRVLLRRPGQVYSREQLMQEVWDEPEMALDRTIDTHIKSLRMKLREAEASIPGGSSQAATSNPEEIIVTHRGLGYSIKEQVS